MDYTSIKLTNLTTNESIVISDLPENFDLVLEYVDWSQVESSSNYIKYINLIGERLTSVSLNTREIEIVGWIVATNQENMELKKRNLNRFINPLQEIQLDYDRYSINFKPDKSIEYNSQDSSENCDVLCRFLISGTAAIPLFRLTSEDVYRDTAIQSVPLFPWISPINKGFVFGIMSEYTVSNVMNEGDVDQGFVLRLVAAHGDVTNPKVTDNKTGKFIQLLLFMNEGDIVEISTETGNKYVHLIQGEQVTDIFRYVSENSTMSLNLSVGENDLSITADTNQTNLTATIRFSPMWLEVQK